MAGCPPTVPPPAPIQIVLPSRLPIDPNADGSLADRDPPPCRAHRGWHMVTPSKGRSSIEVFWLFSIKSPTPSCQNSRWAGAPELHHFPASKRRRPRALTKIAVERGLGADVKAVEPQAAEAEIANDLADPDLANQGAIRAVAMNRCSGRAPEIAGLITRNPS